MPMKNKFWEIKNEAEAENAEILFYGDISNETWYGDEITPKQFAQDLNSLGGKDVVLRINSGGGDVFAAHAIYNFLKGYKGNISAKIDGMCASAATIVACAADSVSMPKNAVFMIHNPVVGLVGYYDAEETKKMSKYLNTVKDTIISVYLAKNSALSATKLSRLMDNETWMTADEALSYGFVDTVDELTAVENSVKDGLITLNSVSFEAKKFKNSQELTDILNGKKKKEEKILEKNEILEKIKNILWPNAKPEQGEDAPKETPQNAAPKDIVLQERERIMALDAVQSDNPAVKAIIATAKKNGQTLAEVQPFIDAMPEMPQDSANALDAIRALIADEMESGAKDVIPQPHKKGTDDAAKKKAAVDEVVNFANAGKV